jgi:hypothetical protein
MKLYIIKTSSNFLFKNFHNETLRENEIFLTLTAHKLNIIGLRGC